VASPANKSRKFSLRPIVVEKSSLQLIKQSALDILERPPYASLVFLNAFLALARSENDE
jgi:hypothetical protein